MSDTGNQVTCGLIIDSTACAWPHQVRLTLHRAPTNTLGLSPRVRVVLNLAFIPDFVMLMD